MIPIVGHMYVIAGRGEMLCESSSTNSIRMLQHGNFFFYTREKDVVREATPNDVARRHEQAKARDVDCKDVECWCRTRGAP